jgi:hypothetical protein
VEAKNGLIYNCKSDTVRMFLECLGFDTTSIINVNYANATKLYNYGVRYSGAGYFNIRNSNFTLNPQIDIGSLMTEFYGLYIITDLFGREKIKTYTAYKLGMHGFRYGVKVEKGTNQYIIDTLILNNITYSNSYTGNYLIEEGAVDSLLID